MAKRKKVKSKALSPKLQEAQHRKVFIRKLINFAEATGIEDFRLLISQDILAYLFDMRMKICPLVAASADISPATLKEVQLVFDYLLTYYKITIQDSQQELTLRDMLTYGHNLYYYLDSGNKTQPSEILKQRAAEYKTKFENEISPYSHLNLVIWCTSQLFNELANRLYWVTHDFKIESSQLVHKFHLHVERPEQRKVKIKGIVRIVSRLGWAFPAHGPMWVSIDKALFDDKLPAGIKSLPVYIQAHALHRLEERLDVLAQGMAISQLYLSVNEPVIVECEGRKFIEYRCHGCRLGYLAADVIGNMLVIRTFLFVTMDNTPEGKALHEIIGLEAIDKRYLAIDRLSTFLHSDIAKHPDIKEYFVKAGCKDLFTLNIQTLEAEKQIQSGEFIRAYLQKNCSFLPTLSELPQEEQLLEEVNIV